MNTLDSSPHLMSFSSLPEDIVLSCLARVSRIYYPTLSFVSKSFRSLLSSRELYVTRTLIEKTEDILYVCLNLNKAEPRWFALSQIPKQQKLISLPWFPYTNNSTVVSTGSEIYIIGGLSNGERSKRVFCLGYQSHQWRRLPDMHVARDHPAADVIGGKIHVIGGNTSVLDSWGEVYNPKTQTWTPLAKTTLDLTIQKSVIPDKLVMGGHIYSESGAELYQRSKYCFVELENVLHLVFIGEGKLVYCFDPEEDVGLLVLGLEQLSTNELVAVVNSKGGRRVIVWWKTVMYRHQHGHYTKECEIDDLCQNQDYNTEECKTYIWCAEISLERLDEYHLRGFVEWSKCVIYYDGYEDCSNFFLDFATTMPHGSVDILGFGVIL